LPIKAAYNGVGQVAFLQYVKATNGSAAGIHVYAGSTYSGSKLTHAGVRIQNDWTQNAGGGGIRSQQGYRMSGTWRALGYGQGNGYVPVATLFVRIS
jgi:hypothetical protein